MKLMDHRLPESIATPCNSSSLTEVLHFRTVFCHHWGGTGVFLYDIIIDHMKRYRHFPATVFCLWPPFNFLVLCWLFICLVLLPTLLLMMAPNCTAAVHNLVFSLVWMGTQTQCLVLGYKISTFLNKQVPKENNPISEPSPLFSFKLWICYECICILLSNTGWHGLRPIFPLYFLRLPRTSSSLVLQVCLRLPLVVGSMPVRGSHWSTARVKGLWTKVRLMTE